MSRTLLDWNATGYRYQVVPAGGGDAGWELPGYDDSAWSVGQAGFGDDGNAAIIAAGVNTWWSDPASHLLLRRELELHGRERCVITSRIDDQAWVYVDGEYLGDFVISANESIDPIPGSYQFDAGGTVVLAARVSPVGPSGFRLGTPAFVDFHITSSRLARPTLGRIGFG